MEIKCIVEQRKSKLGVSYFVAYMPDIEKAVFLSKQEMKLLNLIYKTNSATR